jgi:DNA-binding transcriptional MerR regulator
MADSERDLVAVPRLAEEVGVTPRVIRYWEEQGLLGPTREHGKLRYSARDRAIARLIKRLLDQGLSVDEVRMLRTVAEREVRAAAALEDHRALTEDALRILYLRKSFREVTRTDEEHCPDEAPSPPPPPEPGHGPRRPSPHG